MTTTRRKRFSVAKKGFRQPPLFEMMLESASESAALGDYEPALEHVLAVMSVDPACVRANIAFIQIALSLLSSPKLGNPFVDPSRVASLQAALSRNADGICAAYTLSQIADTVISRSEKSMLIRLARDFTHQSSQCAELQTCSECLVSKADQLVHLGEQSFLPERPLARIRRTLRLLQK